MVEHCEKIEVYKKQLKQDIIRPQIFKAKTNKL